MLAQAIEQRVIEPCCTGIGVAALAGIERDEQQVFSTEAGIDAVNALEATPEEHRGNHEDERQRYLQRTREALTIDPARRHAVSRDMARQRLMEVEPRGASGLRETERQPGKHRRSTRGEEHTDAGNELRCGALGWQKGQRAWPMMSDAHQPSSPPVTESTRHSVTSCRTVRRGVAPTDSRIAISRRRAMPRARSRFPMFAQAMTKSTPTADRSIMSACPYCPRGSESPRLAGVSWSVT